MIVLVVNAGSSSLKYQLVDTVSEVVWAEGLVERIGEEESPAHAQVADPGGADSELVETTSTSAIPDHGAAFHAVTAAFEAPAPSRTSASSRGSGTVPCRARTSSASRRS